MVLQWIVNDNIGTIGIHGMGGVGKTTILKHVYNQLLAEGNYVNVRKLQCDIGNAFGLNLSREKDILERSRLLLQALERRKRVVIVLTTCAAMRGNRDIVDWTVALNDLKDFNNRIMDMEDIVFEHLRFSYERLANKRLRNCFLVDFWIMDGLIKESNRQDELHQGQFILKKLKDHCLLESVNSDHVEDDDMVKMHDLIRDMALQITNKSFMVKAGVLLTGLPTEIEWGENLERASFMKTDTKKVLISPICSNLSTFFLRSNTVLNCITHNFLVSMQCLRVLDLKGNSALKWTPDSISDLVNLHALRLSKCRRLERVPSLAKLVLLRTLELDRTATHVLPEGTEFLVNLRCLNLNSIRLRETIPMGLILKLSALQELYLGINVDKLYVVGRCPSFVEELLSLKELESLHTAFHCLFDYASFVGSAKPNGLKGFFLAIGEDFSPCSSLIQNSECLEMSGFTDLRSINKLGQVIEFRECRIDRCNTIELRDCPNIYTIFKGFPNISLLSCLKKLQISGRDNLKNVILSSRLEQLQNLEEILVFNCDELQELIGRDEDEMGEGSRTNVTTNLVVLPRLKILLLDMLVGVKCIWRGIMVCDSLQRVEVARCPELKVLPLLKGEE
ncbi:hypothetical protein AQUCO_05900047v1 [Aquilegia coerulea]|uniref:Uncharacterized protein n=1 Tax=Aquilegia coerulea TaxID=218851 RepID=A0A2G5CE64_AQUCA|nr:hypothetical protein AQUCO_05900047v1 [Aquilegia coerulea]